MNVRYKENALDCIRLAQGSDDGTEKALLLGLAQAWLRLGEQGKAIGELNALAGRPGLAGREPGARPGSLEFNRDRRLSLGLRGDCRLCCRQSWGAGG